MPDKPVLCRILAGYIYCNTIILNYVIFLRYSKRPIWLAYVWMLNIFYIGICGHNIQPSKLESQSQYPTAAPHSTPQDIDTCGYTCIIPFTVDIRGYRCIMPYMISREAAPFNLRRLAYDRIREMLGRGKFPPGVRVSTQELAKQLGISRTPVREALSQLASQGLVREMPGFGVYVQLPVRQELEELYGMREILESYATSMAVKYISDGELAQMSFCCEQLLALT